MQQANRSPKSRLEWARKLYREYYAICFWHMKPDLDITEATIPTIIRELRRYGGRRGMTAAAELENGEVKLEWCADSTFRFFPVQPDPDFGYCLHPADLATNKMLALAGRAAIRDFLDIIYLHENYLSVRGLCWAACGKDQSFTPWSLLDHAGRNTKYRQEDLDEEHLTRPLRLTDLKKTWLRAAAEAEAWFEKLPAADVGCLYLDTAGVPFMPDPLAPEFAAVCRHFGSARGALPKPVEL